MPTTNYTRNHAFRYRKAGFSVIPISCNGDKRPYTSLLPCSDGKPSWSMFKTKLPTKGQMYEMFDHAVPMGVAIIAGEVSGGLEIVDIDDGKTWQRYRHAVEKEMPGLLDRIPQVISPREGAGRHLYVFSDRPGGNCTLARNNTGEKIIEVKGTGGYCLAPGSHPKCHPTQREYEHDPDTPAIMERPKVTGEERTSLFDIAASFNEFAEKDSDNSQWNGQEPNGNPDSPGNIYMRRKTFATVGLLEKHGWQSLGEYGENQIAWARPGRKKKGGHSALSGKDRHGNDRLTVFSTKGGPLKEQHSYNLLQAYVALECKGDYSKAAMRLAKAGYTGAEEDAAQPLSQELCLPVSFPVDLLPSPCAEFITAVATTLSCDPAFVGVSLLGALGGAIGYRRAAVFREDYVQPATIWTGIIASSGTVKSPSWKAACQPLQDLQDKAYIQYRSDVEDYKEQKEQYETARKNRAESRPSKPTKPSCKRYIVDDITIERLAVILHENPEGVTLCRNELAGWLSSFNQYKSKGGSDEERWIEIWDGNPLTYDRQSLEEELLRVRKPSVSVVGTIQPAVFRRLMCGRRLENGMAQRVLWARPPSASQKWKQSPISAKIQHRMRRLFTRLTDLQMAEGDIGMEPVTIPVSEEALCVWQPWYEDISVRAGDEDELIRSVWAKLHIYAARFSLIFHLVEYPSEAEIGARTVEKAISLAEWFAQELKRVYAVGLAEDEDAELMLIAEAVHRRGGEMSPRDLAHSGPRCVRGDTEAAESRLQQLKEKGWGDWLDKRSGGRGGRPTKVFKLDPRGPKTSKNDGIGFGYGSSPLKAQTDIDEVL